MQNDPRFFAGQGGYGYGYGAEEYHHNVPMGGYYGYGAHATPFFDAAPPLDNGGIQLQASANCPENYVIFDQTDHRSRIMYNPTCGPNFEYPDCSLPGYRNQPSNNPCNNQSSSSSFKEDSDEIDALLSLENDEEDEEDDVVSTGRTPCNYRCDSPDSICSTGKNKVGAGETSPASASTSKETKKDRMRKMVKTLRGIVPGARQMDTPAFLDEAVRYLKSLKVEARKLGIKN